MGNRQRLQSAIVGISLAAAAMLAGGAAFHWWNPRRTIQIVNLPAPPRQAAATTAPTPQVVSAAPIDGAPLAAELRDKNSNVRRQAAGQISALAAADLRSLAVNWPKWAPLMLKDGQFKLVERLSLAAILERPYDATVVQAAERARVLALIAEQNFAAALPQARSYYNVAALAATGEAVDLLAQVLEKTSDSQTAQRFRMEQAAPSGIGTAADSGAAAAVSFSSAGAEIGAGVPRGVIFSISIFSPDYDNAVAALESHVDRHGKYSLNNWLARGNLLLLSGHPAEARECFEEACKLATASRDLRVIVEGVARSLRAQDGNMSRATAFLTELAQDPAAAGAALRKSDSLPADDLRLAAEAVIGNARLRTSVEPPLEQQRAAQETDSPSGSPVRIVSGFEASTPIYVASVSPTHLVVELLTPGLRDWFMFRVEGAAGKTIRMDVTGGYKTDENWSLHEWSVDPVYTSVPDLSDPAAYAAGNSDSAPPATAWNGPALSATNGQQWHYIRDVWSDPYTLSFVQRFDSDSVTVAMRVPYPPSYNQRYLAQLAANPLAQVIEIGRSAQNRPLLLVKIGAERRDKPCVVVYAGEHADEPDASWVAQGVVEYLLSNSADAARLRRQFTFLVIPVLDPDGAAAGIHQGMIISFATARATPESIAYADYFQNWINAGHRLDLVLDLHNVQSSEGPHVFCALMEYGGERGKASAALHRLLIQNLAGTNLIGRPAPGQRGWMPDRLGGWLTHYYGALTMAYEVNSQAPDRHLNLVELKRLGSVFVRTAAHFLSGGDAAAVLSDIDSRRMQRNARWASLANRATFPNAIVSEAFALTGTTAKTNVELADPAVP
jgi:hypothetical protein